MTNPQVPDSHRLEQIANWFDHYDKVNHREEEPESNPEIQNHLREIAKRLREEEPLGGAVIDGIGDLDREKKEDVNHLPVDLGPIGLPKSWSFVKFDGSGGYCYNHDTGLRAVRTCHVESDGNQWVHVSISRRGGKARSICPTMDDMRIAKNLFIGQERRAIQIFFKREEHVNKHVVHLFCCLDSDDVLPEFDYGEGV